MILPASYSNGFAPRDGSPLYPSLWRGCVGAWAPCLGPSGLTLRDWSGFGNHGTLTSMTAAAWTPSGGRYGLLFDGVDDYVPVSTSRFPSGNSALTFSLWFNPASIGTARPLIGYGRNGTGTWVIVYVDSGGRVVMEFGNGSGSVVGTTVLVVGRWYHIAAIYDRSQTRIAINGITESSTAYSSANIDVNRDTDSQPIGGIGSYFTQFATQVDNGLATERYTSASGSLDDVRIYNRALSANEIRLLATRPGIAYEIAPRRRSSSAVQFNRRRRLLLGAQS